MTTPALYECRITHARRRRVRRRFRHRDYFWLVDLDELPARRLLARFRPGDHLDGTGPTLRAGVERWLAARGVDLEGGRVIMLAHARVLGYVFNPLTLFWCHHRDGRLACVLAEVHNTYRERHGYLLEPDERGRARVPKEFYVSPFLTVEGHYEMSVPVPAEQLDVAVTLHQGGRIAFGATIRGRRRPATLVQLLRLQLRTPLPTHRVWALIRGHGIVLWLRRLPVTPRIPARAGHQEAGR